MQLLRSVVTMYEYKTTTCWGATLPGDLIAPAPGFRLRDFKAVTTMETESHTVVDRHSSIANSSGVLSSLNIPYVTSITRNNQIQWVILWEKFVEQEIK